MSSEIAELKVDHRVRVLSSNHPEVCNLAGQEGTVEKTMPNGLARVLIDGKGPVLDRTWNMYARDLIIIKGE